MPLLFLEPSCQSAFADDYPTLVDAADQAAAREVASRCQSVESYFARHLAERADSLTWRADGREILLHGHCHQKALWGTGDTLALLRCIPGAHVRELDTGCCGVAGSFGYEHHEISLRIAEDRLLPAIRANPHAIVAAPGTSCRAQIHDAGFHAQHPVEVVLDSLCLS